MQIHRSKKTGLSRRIQIDGSKWMGPNWGYVSSKLDNTSLDTKYLNTTVWLQFHLKTLRHKRENQHYIKFLLFYLFFYSKKWTWKVMWVKKNIYSLFLLPKTIFFQNLFLWIYGRTSLIPSLFFKELRGVDRSQTHTNRWTSQLTDWIGPEGWFSDCMIKPFNYM